MSDKHDESDDDLVDYEEVPEAEKEAEAEKEKEKGGAKGSYTTLHSSSFRDFLLKAEVMRAIGDAGFEHPSEVQHNAIPAAMVGTDLICQAKSGMGKTAVFVISTLQQIQPSSDVDTLVMCHTRELAFQICAEFERFARYLPKVNVAVVYGGVPVMQQVSMLRQERPNVVVGTPGRVLDLVQRGELRLDNVKRFILDECDNMLDQLDMRKQVQETFKRTPHDKQVMLFSATIPSSVKPICRKLCKNPQEIYIDDKLLTLHGLQQHYVKLREDEKNRKLNDLMDALDFNQVVIFVKSRQRAYQLDKLLRACAFPSMVIHAGMRQEERLARFKKFKDYKCRILVSTNLFGRGVDIERVNIVINYDMAQNSDEYLHRVGRAGRFGTKGLSISFVSNSDDARVLEDVQDRFEVKITTLPDEVETSSYMAS